MTEIKETYYIDFDKLFENYADKYYNEHESEYEAPDDFAYDLDKVYNLWATSPQDVLGGLSPTEFFDGIPTADLPDILKGACAGDGNPSSLLFDRIARERSLMGELCEIARASSDNKLLDVVFSLLEEMGGADNAFYLEMIVRADIETETKEHCLEPLCDRVASDESLRDEILERTSHTEDINILELYAEVLSFAPSGNDKILELLRMLLGVDANTAYIAALMGRYGDDRAATDLYSLLDDCTYATFIEVRNAIEALGGTVDDHYRDFSDDPTYKALKNLK
ncbi:MAG: hypothetical protein J1G04_00235 [Clostridiales bacterium]|nr:hypothetical protein [Clostridiales bacterium]